jgi:L,D-transpeptidase ErfK/SrfK
MYLQAFPVLEDDQREHPAGADAVLKAGISDEMWQRVKAHNVAVDLDLVTKLVEKPRGIAIPVSRRGLTVDKFVYASRHVENRLPEGANWNGKEELLVSEEQFQATRSGTILPNESAPKKAAKAIPKKKPAAAPATAAAPAAKSGQASKSVPLEASLDVERATPPKKQPAGAGAGSRE